MTRKESDPSYHPTPSDGAASSAESVGMPSKRTLRFRASPSASGGDDNNIEFEEVMDVLAPVAKRPRTMRFAVVSDSDGVSGGRDVSMELTVTETVQGTGTVPAIPPGSTAPLPAVASDSDSVDDGKDAAPPVTEAEMVVGSVLGSAPGASLLDAPVTQIASGADAIPSEIEGTKAYQNLYNLIYEKYHDPICQKIYDKILTEEGSSIRAKLLADQKALLDAGSSAGAGSRSSTGGAV